MLVYLILFLLEIQVQNGFLQWPSLVQLWDGLEARHTLLGSQLEFQVEVTLKQKGLSQTLLVKLWEVVFQNLLPLSQSVLEASNLAQCVQLKQLHSLMLEM